MAISMTNIPFVMFRSYLDQEQPSPTGLSVNTSHLQETGRKKRRNDIRDRQSSPEESETNGQLVVLVEV